MDKIGIENQNQGGSLSHWRLEKRKQNRVLDPHIEEHFASRRLLACVSPWPGQCGRADGYILEGKELEFYMKKIKRKKGKGAA